MFSIFGTSGRLFQGSLEDLRNVGPTTALIRSRVVQGLGQDGREPFEQNARAFAQPQDIAHKVALNAYEGTRRVDVQRHPLTRVDALMSTKVLTVTGTETVEHAWALLAGEGIGQAPVVDAAGVLIGLLSRGDLMRADHLPKPDSHALVWRAFLAQTVADVMWTPVPSVAPDTDIRRVARVLLDTGLPGLPVADASGQVIGFVSRSDILRAVVADPPLDLWS